MPKINLVENNINLKTFQLKQTIVQAVNSSGLPPVCVRAALEGIYNEVLDLEQKAIMEEQNSLVQQENQNIENQGDKSNGNNNAARPES